MKFIIERRDGVPSGEGERAGEDKEKIQLEVERGKVGERNILFTETTYRLKKG